MSRTADPGTQEPALGLAAPQSIFLRADEVIRIGASRL
jgi:hypothetical protein